MRLRPITLRAANAFIAEHHRHHKPVRGCNFCLSVVDTHGEILGVAVVGRPLARMLDDGLTAEVTRLCVKAGVPHACSMLYSAAARACRAIGYQHIISYILESESGVSLLAAGWTFEKTGSGGSWSRSSRARISTNTQPKKRFGKDIR